ncbi:uncharacterized protein GGS22DRAFT_37755 [Annulohypoxylon maeteangense]|uniref:uncharacterized protein n=1 Tax=Annulohypoxylon maeteangense TaxID=1927788 RepID=UPI00200761E8|nr:uncharacterized protein GGS22DRAFT_37755 [Annulohypoxylon maeteangense]KAI0883242.1 hypothetical protein GGS22DRAFT_37755 [Annulohypoxylon maeteangense]
MSQRTVPSPLEVLYSRPHDSTDERIEIDIIAVHGLGSNVDWSWIWKDGVKQIHWLKDPDMLPAVVPNARIITYSYESRWHANAPKTRLELCGEELARSIHDFRAEIQDRPVLFIAHSLGGLVVIHALLYANRTEDLKYLPQETAGFIALGTPFRGTGMHSLAETVTRFLTPLGSHDGLFTDMKLDDKHLADKVHEFCELRNKLEIPSWCFIELLESDYGKKVGIPWVFKGIVVEEASAHIPGWGRTGLNTDHFYLNKFSGPDDGSFMAVSREVRQMYTRVYTKLGHPRKPLQFKEESGQDDLQQIPTGSEDRFKEMLQALYFGQINSRRHNLALPSPNTCTWILGTAQYKDWVSPTKSLLHDNILWIKGKPGVGKSTLLNFLYEESDRMMPDTKKFSFFFNARGNQLEKSTIGLCRAILWDILRTFKHLIKVFDDVILDYIKTDGWKEQHIYNLLGRAIGRLRDQPLVCYIDALDECPEDQVRFMVDQFRKISNRATKSGSGFKICLSSRHYPNISIRKSLSLTLEEHYQHELDMRCYIDSELIDQVEKVDREQAIRIQDKLLKKSSSVFLYVKLVIGRIKKDFDNGMANAKTLERRLDGLPKGLSALYCEMLARRSEDVDDDEDDEDVEATRVCLRWVLFALRPLEPVELYYAIRLNLRDDTALDGEDKPSKETMRRFILRSSKGFVEILSDNRRKHTVQFIHESVQDYFLSESGHRVLYPSLRGSFPGESHDALKQVCYKGIKKAMCKQEWKGKLYNPFLASYAIHGALIHSEKAQSFGVQQRDFLSDFSVDIWMKALTNSRFFNIGDFNRYNIEVEEGGFILNEGESNTHLLYILAMADQPNLVRAHPDRARHMEVKGGRYGAPLAAALAFGHQEIVRDLGLQVFLDQNLPISFNEENDLPTTISCPYHPHRAVGIPLYDLIHLDCVSAVKVLEYKGEDLNQYNSKYGRPLSWAMRNEAVRVVEWLLSRKHVDPNFQDEDGKSPLHYICQEKWHSCCEDYNIQVELLQRFLKNSRVLPDLRDKKGRTPFSYAAENGFLEVAKMLFATGSVDKDSRCDLGRSPLSYASKIQPHEVRNSMRMIQWLLSLEKVERDSHDASN